MKPNTTYPNPPTFQKTYPNPRLTHFIQSKDVATAERGPCIRAVALAHNLANEKPHRKQAHQAPARILVPLSNHLGRPPTTTNWNLRLLLCQERHRIYQKKKRKAEEMRRPGHGS